MSGMLEVLDAARAVVAAGVSDDDTCCYCHADDCAAGCPRAALRAAITAYEAHRLPLGHAFMCCPGGSRNCCHDSRGPLCHRKGCGQPRSAHEPRRSAGKAG